MGAFDKMETWHWIVFGFAMGLLAFTLLTLVIVCIRRPMCRKRRQKTVTVEPKLAAVAPGAPPAAAASGSRSSSKKKKKRHRSSDSGGTGDSNLTASLASDRSFQTKEVIQLQIRKKQTPTWKTRAQQSPFGQVPLRSAYGRAPKSFSGMPASSSKSSPSGLAPPPAVMLPASALSTRKSTIRSK